MKKMYYLILIVLFPSCTITKPLLLSFKDYTVEKELSSDKKKNDLFIIANAWMVESFNNATNVIQFSDKEEGIIIGRYLIGGTYSPPQVDNRVYAIITIRVKDNLTKIRISPQGEAKYYPPNPDNNINFRSSVLTADEVKSLIGSTIDEYQAYIMKYKKW